MVKPPILIACGFLFPISKFTNTTQIVSFYVASQVIDGYMNFNVICVHQCGNK